MCLSAHGRGILAKRNTTPRLRACEVGVLAKREQACVFCFWCCFLFVFLFFYFCVLWKIRVFYRFVNRRFIQGVFRYSNSACRRVFSAFKVSMCSSFAFTVSLNCSACIFINAWKRSNISKVCRALTLDPSACSSVSVVVLSTILGNSGRCERASFHEYPSPSRVWNVCRV